MMSPERIALFGGSFNPPHVSHVMTIAYCLACLPIDRVWVLPTYRHALGKDLVGFEDRFEMCRRATRPFGERVHVSDLERQLGGESRTIRLVEHLLDSGAVSAISLIIGADILGQTDRWLEFDRLVRLTELVVMGRAGSPFNSDPRVKTPAMPGISSTTLRRMLASPERPEVIQWMPREVLAYIEARQLYVGSQQDA